MERLREPGHSSAVEQAMRCWELRRQSERQHAKQSRELRSPPYCITISREAGARGSTVARLVAEKVRWTVYDQELLEYIAHTSHQRASVLESLDVETLHWMHEWLAALLQDQWQDQDAYIVHLAKVVMAIGLCGEAIIVGRGAACILPSDISLKVRLIARNSDRIAFLSQVERLTPQEAERYMRETDAQRKKFVRDYFHRDNEDMHEYDLVLDSSILGEECCADLIVAALQGKEAFTRNRQTARTRVSHVPHE